MTEVLVRILVDQLCFLELSGDDVVHPDAAVQQIESVVAELESLAQDQRRELLVLLRAAASAAKASQRSEATLEFIESLPEVLQLVDSAR